MTYEVIADPYCTGDRWHKEYELNISKQDSEDLYEYLLDGDFEFIPRELEMPVDGDDGVVTFLIYPHGVLSKEHEEAFLKYLASNEE